MLPFTPPPDKQQLETQLQLCTADVLIHVPAVVSAVGSVLLQGTDSAAYNHLSAGTSSISNSWKQGLNTASDVVS